MLVFCEKTNDLCKVFKSREFVILLAFFADIFSHLNDLNIKMQGTGMIFYEHWREDQCICTKIDNNGSEGL